MITPEVKLREKGRVTILAEILQEWGAKNHVQTEDIRHDDNSLCIKNAVYP